MPPKRRLHRQVRRENDRRFFTLRFRCCGLHGTASRAVLSCNAPSGRRSKKHRLHKWRLRASFALGSSNAQPNFRFSPLPLEANTRRNDAGKSRHRWRRLNCFFPTLRRSPPFRFFSGIAETQPRNLAPERSSILTKNILSKSFPPRRASTCHRGHRGERIFFVKNGRARFVRGKNRKKPSR